MHAACDKQLSHKVANSLSSSPPPQDFCIYIVLVKFSLVSIAIYTLQPTKNTVFFYTWGYSM